MKFPLWNPVILIFWMWNKIEKINAVSYWLCKILLEITKSVVVKPASNDLGVYVNKFGKTSVVWRYTLQSIGPSGIAQNY